jgi:lysophospholipase L1-like esterase
MNQMAKSYFYNIFERKLKMLFISNKKYKIQLFSKYILKSFALIIFLFGKGYSQNKDGYKWYNPELQKSISIEGRGWSDKAIFTYDRLPEKAKTLVREPVWNLSKHTAGLSIRFKSNAKEMLIRYKTVNKEYSMPHMPATGVSGIDLYAKNNEGNWVWFKGNYSFGDTITYSYKNINLKVAKDSMGFEYQLFFPLYNAIEWFEIGIPAKAQFAPLPLRKKKPIVVYGTSIAQGACASRPGMAWTSILERKLNRPVINLGFSGNGRLEMEMIDLISEIDAKIYVLDCLPNLILNKIRTSEKVYEKIISSVKKIREKHPEIPILLVDHAGYADGMTNRNRLNAYSDLNQINHKAYGRLKDEGVYNIFILKKKELGLQLDSFVDGTHPSDLGMVEYAGAFEKMIHKIIDDKKLHKN